MELPQDIILKAIGQRFNIPRIFLTCTTYLQLFDKYYFINQFHHFIHSYTINELILTVEARGWHSATASIPTKEQYCDPSYSDYNLGCEIKYGDRPLYRVEMSP